MFSLPINIPNSLAQNRERVILHVDMNAFFASVEQKDNPDLCGKPVAVIGSAKRTVIVTASYEARHFGVKTGMTVYEGKKACPDLILVIGDHKKYTRISAEIIKFLGNFTSLLEPFSIDEAFLDITGSLILFGGAEKIARMIKDGIKEHFGLLCSVGIAPNKLLAKLAGEMQKPDGLVRIRPEEISAVLEDLPVGSLCGIGRQTERALHDRGVNTCGQLGRYPVAFLKKRFGIVGEYLHYMGLGIDYSPVVPQEKEPPVKSVGHSRTLSHDIFEKKDILRHLLQLAHMVGRRLRRYKLSGRTVALTVRYKDFTTFTRRHTGTEYIDSDQDIFQAAVHILEQNKPTAPVRLLGISVANLAENDLQLSLFPEESRKVLLSKAMDTVLDRFGETSLTYATLLGNKKAPQVISPSWRPTGVRNHTEKE